MILGAHQPNYLPWIGYFLKIARADHFVLADNTQYTRQSYINRTRIKIGNRAHWLSVPVLSSALGPQEIHQVGIDNSKNWARKHWQTIRNQYHNTPGFARFGPGLEEIYGCQWNRLVDLNCALLEYFCRCFEIFTPLTLGTALKIDAADATDRIVQMVLATGCNTYLSGTGGSLNYLCPHQVEAAGIGLRFLEVKHPLYPQSGRGFIAGLSALDFLFNTGMDAPAFFAAFAYPESVAR